MAVTSAVSDLFSSILEAIASVFQAIGSALNQAVTIVFDSSTFRFPFIPGTNYLARLCLEYLTNFRSNLETCIGRAPCHVVASQAQPAAQPTQTASEEGQLKQHAYGC